MKTVTSFNVFNVVAIYVCVQYAKPCCILISDLVAAKLFMHSLPGMILFYLATPFLHWRCSCVWDIYIYIHTYIYIYIHTHIYIYVYILVMLHKYVDNCCYWLASHFLYPMHFVIYYQVCSYAQAVCWVIQVTVYLSCALTWS